MHGTDRPAWWRVHEGEPLLLRPFGIRWMVVWNAYRDRSQRTPRAALDAMAPGTPLPVGLSDDGTWTEPEAAPEPWTPKVGEWVTFDEGVSPYFVVSCDSVRALGVDSGGQFRLHVPRCHPATRPDASWAIALDPKPVETVTDDYGREWLWTASQGWVVPPFWCRPEMIRARCWTDGAVWSYGQRIATLPDTLRGLARLNAASAMLDKRWGDVPDGVEVASEWRGPVDVERRTRCPGMDDGAKDDRPATAWEVAHFAVHGGAESMGVPDGWEPFSTFVVPEEPGGPLVAFVACRRRVEVPRG